MIRRQPPPRYKQQNSAHRSAHSSDLEQPRPCRMLEGVEARKAMGFPCLEQSGSFDQTAQFTGRTSQPPLCPKEQAA